MLADKIKIFELAKSEVEIAIRSNNESLIRSRDRELDQAWNDLIDFEPANNEDRMELARFLLSQIRIEFGDARLIEQIRDRVLKLISYELG